MSARVANATSFDDRFDPSNVLSSENNFWITTGLYPQELMIEFAEPTPIQNVEFIVNGARKITIEGSKQSNRNDFTKIGESDELQNRQTMQQG